jgi:hypothetical protein
VSLYVCKTVDRHRSSPTHPACPVSASSLEPPSSPAPGLRYINMGVGLREVLLLQTGTTIFWHRTPNGFDGSVISLA